MSTNVESANTVTTISPIIASISSNDAKILALERRMAGHDPMASKSLAAQFAFGQPAALTSRPPPDALQPTHFGVNPQRLSLSSSEGAAPGADPQAQGPAPAGPGHIPAPSAANAAGNGPPSKRPRTSNSPLAAPMVAASPLRTPLSDITPPPHGPGPDAEGSASAGRGMARLPSGPWTAHPASEAAFAVDSALQPQPHPEPQPGQPPQAPAAQPPPPEATAAAAGPAGRAATAGAGGRAAGAAGGGRTRKRKQQEPKHQGAGAGAGAGDKEQREKGAAGGAGAACEAGGAAAAEPARAGTPIQQAGRKPLDPASRPRPSGSSVSSAGAAGRHANGAGAGNAPPSAQKRGGTILSFYTPLGAPGGGATAATHMGAATGAAAAAGCESAPGGAGMAGLLRDQASRDGLPAAAQPQHPQPQPQAQQAAGAAATAAAAAAAAAAHASAVAGSVGAALAMQQHQQQIVQLQAQIIQMQAAVAAAQGAAAREIERVRREAEARDAELVQLRERCRAQEAALHAAAGLAAAEAAARAELEALRASSAAEACRWAAEAEAAARVAGEREERYRAELARALQAAARAEREVSRGSLAAGGARLGTLGLMRTGPMQIAEVWEDGPALQALAARRAELAARREAVAAAQKQLRKRLAPPPAGARTAAAAAPASAAAEEGAAEGAGYLSGPDFVAADEALKVRLAQLKREEEALKEEEERLNRDKLKQIRALALAREEDSSRFGRWPLLPHKPGPEGRPRYVMLNLLGKGGFSEVFKAYDLHEARHVCVKIHALNPGWTTAKKDSFVRHAIREYDIQRSLRHPAVVALLDVLEIDTDTFATVLELCEGGDLEGLMRDHKTLPEREARVLIAQIFSGLRCLAAARVIHYDLKPANVLLDALGQAKITDFGLSKTVAEGHTLCGIELTSQGAGTYWYLPPEAFETGPAPPRISNKVDVWSAGVIFYQLLYGRKPYGENLSQEALARERALGGGPRPLDFPAKPQVSAEAKAFIRRCLAWSQDARPDVEAAAADSYLTAGAGAAAAAGKEKEKEAKERDGGAAAAAAAGGAGLVGLAGRR